MRDDCSLGSRFELARFLLHKAALLYSICYSTDFMMSALHESKIPYKSTFPHILCLGFSVAELRIFSSFLSSLVIRTSS